LRLGRLRGAGLAGQQFTRAEHAKAASDAEQMDRLAARQTMRVEMVSGQHLT
jgi:hypothetical protein